MPKSENLKPWPPERLAYWERTRARGMWHFVLLHGIMQWGGFMFFFSMAVFQHAHFGNVFSTEGNLPFRLILAAITWIFVGFLYGRSAWRRNEAEFAQQRPDRFTAQF